MTEKSETIQTIERIEQDFEQGNGPFADVQFPEERLMEELPHKSMEDRAVLASIFSTFDYNRDANQLVDNLVELYDVYQPWFDARQVTYEANEDVLAETFEEIGFRYPSRDAHAWYVNCEIVTNNYSGKWTELMLDTRLDAPSLVHRLSDEDFLCLKGVKIAPMYARILSENVAELYKLWELDIPVDTHIRTLSHKLFGDEYDDDGIRELWYMHGVTNDIDRHVVDGGLWLIGNNWNDWGEDYWNEVTN
jgi:endonuclease III